MENKKCICGNEADNECVVCGEPVCDNCQVEFDKWSQITNPVHEECCIEEE